MSAHTPGPWQYFSGNRSIWNGDRAVCGLYGPRKAPADYELGEIDANGRLIAAAPELLEALKLIAHATSPAPDDGGFHEAAYDIARAAIAKAEGA